MQSAPVDACHVLLYDSGTDNQKQAHPVAGYRPPPFRGEIPDRWAISRHARPLPARRRLHERGTLRRGATSAAVQMSAVLAYKMVGIGTALKTVQK